MKEIKSILILFLAAQLLGLLVGATLVDAAKVYPEVNEAYNIASSTPGGGQEAQSSLFFLAYIVAGAAALLIILKFYRGLTLFKLLEAAVIVVSSNIVFLVLLALLNAPFPVELSLLLSLALAGLKFAYPARMKNAAAVISSAGVGALFGFSLALVPALILVVGLSVYDALAVFWTKHMLTFARELSQRQLSFSISVEREIPKSEIRRMEKIAKAPKMKLKLKGLERAPVEQRRKMLELGTGDIAIPLMLAVSAYKAGTIYNALAVLLGSSIALVLILDYVLKKQTFLPALPPLSFGGAAFLLISKLAGL